MCAGRFAGRSAGRSAGRFAGRSRRMLSMQEPDARSPRCGSNLRGVKDDHASTPHLYRVGSRRSSWDLARECLQPRAHRSDPRVANWSEASGLPRRARGSPWACPATPRQRARAALPCPPGRADRRPRVEGLTPAAPVAMSARALTRAMRSFKGSAHDTRSVRLGGRDVGPGWLVYFSAREPRGRTRWPICRRAR